ncbi:MAG: type III-B CRISPR module-associated Cmr3 family protein [Spirochaetales bacterium]
MIWYELIPTDTLFFRGAEALEMGADHFALSLFPPPISVFYGAFRTQVLKEKNISYKDYAQHKVDAELFNLIGHPEQSIHELPFTIYGPCFYYSDEVFLPTPLHWYGIKEQQGEIQVRTLKKLPKTDIVKVSKPVLWTTPLPKSGSQESISEKYIDISGSWVNWNSIMQFQENQLLQFYEAKHFFIKETRTGIALNTQRTVREGHLYSMVHIRLKLKVSLCIGLDKKILSQPEGVLFLGGENRFVRYREINPSIKPIPNNGNYYLSFTPIPATTEAEKSLVITEKLLYLGGWDLAKGFHKPLEPHFPAGSVFNSKVSKHCIPIP